MKTLTRIEPEPEHSAKAAESGLVWMIKGKGHSLEDYGFLIRLLIHKVNELTDEVNRIKADKK